jgi:plastocyanin
MSIPIEGEVTMEMGDSFFRLDGQQSPLVLEVAVGQEVTINLVNNGQATCIMHSAGVDNTYDVDFCLVGSDEPGTFGFRCEVHPIQMTGTLIAE